MNNVNLQLNALLIAKSVLSPQSLQIRRERALLFISDDQLLENLVNFEEHLIENDVNHESIIETYYQVMSKLSIHKKFIQKLCVSHKSSRAKILCVLERWKHRYKIVSAILCYLKHLLKSSLCQTILCSQNDCDLDPDSSSRNGLIAILYDILCTHKMLSSTSIKVIETLVIACRCKEGMPVFLNSLSFYVPFLVKQLEECTQLFSNPNIDSKSITKCLRYAYSVLGVFLQSSHFSAGRDHLKHLSVDHKCLSFMRIIVDNNIRAERSQHLDRVFVLSSLVIQRLFDPLPLPLTSHTNPFPFELALNEQRADNSVRNSNGNECNVDENEFYRSDQSDSDNDSVDQNDTESDGSDCDDRDVITYEQYFPEIRDFDWNLNPRSESNQTNDMTESPVIAKESKKSIENIKSLFCSCFANNHNIDNCIEPNDTRDDINDNDSDKNKIDLKDMMKSGREDKRKQLFLESADWRQIYASMAIKTISIQPIVTLAEPELSGSLGNNELEELAPNKTKDPFETTRTRLLEHIIRRFNRRTEEAFVVYDCQQSMAENKQMKHKLQFESRFESGNLRKVVQTDLSSNEYTLLLNSDTNTSSHIQWFYFQVSNTKANVEYVFNIVNMEKQSSLYNEGQRIIMFSTKESQNCDKPFWKRVGYSIAYYRNHYLKDNSIASLMNDKTFFTLTFKLKFEFDSDVCYLAYNYPYSYSFLSSNIHFWQNCHNSCQVYFRHQTLCTSLTGNAVPILTITSAKPSEGQSGRPYIVLMGRVHPAESNSSWIIKGCIDFLLSDRLSAQKLLEKYVFKIIPMLNPDGVINGNSRTGAEGDDLNRQWRRPEPLLHPVVYHMKYLIKYLSHISNNSNPILLVDFHGHSRRKNIFVYGCSPHMSWKKSDRNKEDDQTYLALPLILNSVAPAFSLNHCSFTIEKSRERTARITFWRELGVKLSYTLECTQAGCDQGLYEGMHLGINQLTEMGSKFCSALLKLEFTSDPNQCRLIPIVPKDLLLESNDIASEKSENNSSDKSSDENEFFR